MPEETYMQQTDDGLLVMTGMKMATARITRSSNEVET